MFKKLTFAVMACIASMSMAVCAAPKFIAYGWDVQAATPEDVLANVAEWDKTPMDGCAISIRIPDGKGGEFSYKTLMNDPVWSWKELERYEPILRELSKHRSMKESMLSAFRAPTKRIAWEDDAGWGNVASNMAMMARLAKRGGMRGLLVDPEDYPRSRQFYLLPEDGDRAKTIALARKRGQEVFGAVFREFPDITLFAFWLLSTDKNIYNASDPEAAMRMTGCLFPAFMDGVLDVITPQALLVDANENTYRAEAPYGDYWADAARQRRNSTFVLSPENRGKYRMHHRVGAAFFLDGYIYPPENKWHFPPFNGTRGERLGLNIAAAAEAADYVWLDGQWRCYVPWKGVRQKMSHIAARPTWEDAIPGFWKHIQSAKDPLAVEYGKRTVLADVKAKKVGKADAAVVVKGVKYGEICEVVGSVNTPGALLRVDWKKENGKKWAGRAASVLVVGGRAVFRVPAGVDSFAVVRSTGLSFEKEASYSDIKVSRLEVLSEEERTLTVAANELQKYWGEITGDWKKIPVRFFVDRSVSKSGHDAYDIKSKNGQLHIVGSNARSVLYGLYDFLERRAGCGWFWDGDVIPKRKKIDITGLDIHEESAFRYRGIRYFAHRGLTRFQAEHWGLEDWKREIDWCVKRRLNLFMLRIGQDDFFQKAFPEVCAYPDASKPLPGRGKGYDNRSLFWPLEFRGELRKAVMDYAFARGMMAPEDFGTMTHWYSRTPKDFLEKMKPSFLPQAATSAYGDPTGLVWDIRKKKWMDSYWKITEAAVREYGKPDLLHTIGIAERNVYDDPVKNRKAKTDWTNMLFDGARGRFPNAELLLAGWDLYCMKTPEEVKSFLKNIPEDVVIWDYEADAYRNTNFTEWDVIGKRPYTFGIFMAYEAGLDPRTDYSRIAERQKAIAGDKNCVGYILWPESSHVDSMGLEYFVRNSWRGDRPDVGEIVKGYASRRYAKSDASVMSALWKDTISVSTNMQEIWRWNYALPILREWADQRLVNNQERWPKALPGKVFSNVPRMCDKLCKVDWEGNEFVRRDAMDIARVMADRMAVNAENRLMRAYFDWRDGKGSADAVRNAVPFLRRMVGIMSRLLALHTDYSLVDTLERMKAAHPVANSNFGNVLMENSANSYCASHQAEMAEHLYAPATELFMSHILGKVESGDRSPLSATVVSALRDKVVAKPLDDLRSKSPRTAAAFHAVVREIESAAKELTAGDNK